MKIVDRSRHEKRENRKACKMSQCLGPLNPKDQEKNLNEIQIVLTGI